jgi:hypothetical protein
VADLEKQLAEAQAALAAVTAPPQGEAPAAEPAAEASREAVMAELSAYTTHFGAEAGLKYFTQRKPLASAALEELAATRKRNDELTKRLSGATAAQGEGLGLGDDAVGKFAAADGAGKKPKKSFIRFAGDPAE